MKISLPYRVLFAASTLFSICAANAFAATSSSPHYVVTNDDSFTIGATGVSFYAVGAAGQLTLQQQVLTGGAGIGGGYFAPNRVVALDSGRAQCVYASEAFTGDVVGISVSTLTVGGSAFGSPTDAGTSNGIGLAVNSQYLYASFTDSSTIGTFQVQSGCGLSFVNDASVLGLQGGVISGMAIHGDILVATYNDGSIESFNISSGVPVSNGDKQNSSAYVSSQGATYPNGIDITEDGHFAIFGDTASQTVVEVSDISSGLLTKTIAYTLAPTRNSSNVMLSPDETLLYISNSQGDGITAATFDASTGKLSGVCASPALRNYVSSFSYLGSLALENNSGNGGVLYAAEFGTQSGIAVVQVGSSGGKCTLTELSSSPVNDPYSLWLLSIAGFPPRPF
ncbi:MAG: beta-propeller fold lactonase family protein [Candidatus Sulfotelmatobacter sp.]